MPCYLGQAVEHLLIAGDMVDHSSGGTATCNRWYSLNRVLGWIWVSEVSEGCVCVFDKVIIRGSG
jgi:hypothetical protein